MAKLFFKYASMNAGKSMRLIQESYNYSESGKHVLCFTSSKDTRFGENKIASRIHGFSMKATPYDGLNLLEHILNYPLNFNISAIFIDECQFLDPCQVNQLADIVDQCGIPVLCYGIRTDFLGNTFPGSERLLAIADELEQIRSICSCPDCEKLAQMQMRLDGSGKIVHEGDQVEVGSNDKYIAVCRKHYNLMMKAKSNAPYLL